MLQKTWSALATYKYKSHLERINKYRPTSKKVLRMWWPHFKHENVGYL